MNRDFQNKIEIVAERFGNDVKRFITDLSAIVLEAFDSKPNDFRQYAQPASGQNFLTVKEVAEKFKVSTRMIRDLVKANKIPFRRIQRELRFDPAELDRWTMPQQKEQQRAATNTNR